ncbi:hypothetical protein KRX57_10295 [Weeksellaceae bacterium TAE3-ERU29]|nr:hypothetical protein [Weeksellaceae bacterium TAE3-ERU29]
MKKIYTTLLAVSALYAGQAQVRNNSTPTNNSISGTSAFLDASSSVSWNNTNNIGKGLVFPRTNLVNLTTLKATAQGLPTSFPNRLDGMIVYNTESGTAAIGGTPVKRGFYYYKNDSNNLQGGTWVPLGGSEANAQLWAQRQVNGITETYLKPALANNDFIGYNSDKRFYFKLGDFNNSDFNNYYRHNGISERTSGEVPFGTYITSDVIPLTTSLGFNDDLFYFTQNYALLRENHVQANPRGIYFGNESRLVTKDVTSNTQQLTALNVRNDYYSNANVRNFSALEARSVVGFENGDNVATATFQRAGNFIGAISKNAKTENLSVIKVGSEIYGAVDNIKGIENAVNSLNKDENNTYPTHTIKTMKGIDNLLSVSPNATVEGIVSGIHSYMHVSENTTLQNHIYGKYSKLAIRENVTMAANKKVYGEINTIELESSLPDADLQVSRAYLSLKKNDINVREVRLNDASIDSPGNNTSVVGNMYAFSFQNGNDFNWTADKMYGLHLDDIKNGQTANYGIYMENVGNSTSTNNYAIYTKKGNIRFGDLANRGATADRMVTVNNDGVLSTQDAATFVNSNSEWSHNSATQNIELQRAKQQANGKTVFYTEDGKYRSYPTNLTELEEYNYSNDTKMSVPFNPTDLLGSNENINNTSSLDYKIDIYNDHTFYANKKLIYVDELKDNNGSNSNIVHNSYSLTIPSSYTQSVRLARSGVFNTLKLNSGNMLELTGLNAVATDAGGGEIGSMLGSLNNILIQKPSGKINKAYGTDSQINILSNNKANINEAFGVRSLMKISGEGNVSNLYGFISNIKPNNSYTGNINNHYDFYAASLPNLLNVTNSYGIYIQGDTKANYLEGKLGIGTDTPTEKLEVNGNIKSSSLSGADTRMVVANEDGVLSTQAIPSNLSAKWIEDPSNNAVTLTVNSNGNPRTSNVVSVYDNGEILASGFKGTNGATIFPDYVFENYYTGTSTTKADYNFAKLSQVEDFVKANGHLPGYVSAKEIKAQGYIDIMDTQLTNVEKIEELYLHLIEKEKEVQSLKAELDAQKSRLDKLEQLLNK